MLSGPRSASPGYGGKRALDLAIVLLSSPLALPLCAVVSAWIRLDSAGPVLFRQLRVGYAGRSFEILKFRTMTHGPTPNPLFPQEAQVTRAGRLLRRFSLDELPQLVNVLRGEMSLVGPRPTLAYQVARYSAKERGRLLVRPGITGLAQIRGRNSLAWKERIEHDLEYCRTQSLRLDCWILFASIGVLFSGDGVGGHALDDPIAALEPDADPGT